MAQIINLNSVRKAKSRAAKDRKAEANRARFGRTKVEKARDEAEAIKRDHALDGARIEIDPSEDE